MRVIATAGHVDHGKSTLVRALTGMEPDRWAEERRRGMTIDLGFAWTTLTSGTRLAFVDVPGHERFATNMLAGVGPVPAALLVVAADSGWAAQTEDHVCALDALGVRHGVVAVTRSDLAGPEDAAAEVARRLRGTSLAGSPVVAVSGATGAGVGELLAALDLVLLALPTPDPGARIRLWVDRCFTMRGSGTVVTGTLPEGTLRRGDVLELAGEEVTVRGLQCLGEPVDAVSGTARVAVNLRAVPASAVRRGDALLARRAWRPTAVVDVRFDGLPPADVVVHVGSAAVAARVRRLDTGSGDSVARLTLLAPLPLQVGDRLLLRDPGRRAIVGGATVLDPAPPALRRRGAARARAVDLHGVTGTPDIRGELGRRGAATATLLGAIGVPVPDPLPPGAVAVQGWLVSAELWAEWCRRLRALAAEDGGVVAAGLPRRLELTADRLLAPLLAACGDLEQVDGRVRRRGSGAPGLSPAVAAAVERLREGLAISPFGAPEQVQLAALGLGRRELGMAAAARAILRLPGEIVLLPDAPSRAAACLARLEQPFTVSAARQALDTTRRVAVPLLEHLDSLRITERVADGQRRVRPGAAEPSPRG